MIIALAAIGGALLGGVAIYLSGWSVSSGRREEDEES